MVTPGFTLRLALATCLAGLLWPTPALAQKSKSKDTARAAAKRLDKALDGEDVPEMVAAISTCSRFDEPGSVEALLEVFAQGSPALFPDTRRVLGDGVLRLLLRADEEHRAAALGEVPREVVRFLEQLLGLGEIDDVDATALAEDEAAHLGVPAARLVAEVDAGLQELPHRYD